MSETPSGKTGIWSRLPISLRAIVAGFIITLIGIYPWGAAIYGLGPQKAIPATLAWLALYVIWTRGWLPPKSTQTARRTAFRKLSLTVWGLIGALAFAVAVEAGLFLLFRFVPFPREAFRTLPALPNASPVIIWASIVTGAVVAGIGEEIGLRGYMQQPIEARHGPVLAIFISSALFTAFHLNQAWATPAMLPVIFAAGVLLGLLAWTSGSLLPGIIGHAVMDVCNFAYWWTGYVGDYTQRPIAQTGMDRAFEIEVAIFAVSLIVFIVAIAALRRSSRKT